MADTSKPTHVLFGRKNEWRTVKAQTDVGIQARQDSHNANLAGGRPISERGKINEKYDDFKLKGTEAEEGDKE